MDKLVLKLAIILAVFRSGRQCPMTQFKILSHPSSTCFVNFSTIEHVLDFLNVKRRSYVTLPLWEEKVSDSWKSSHFDIGFMMAMGTSPNVLRFLEP